MILTEEISIKLNSRLINKYKYIGKPGDIISIRTSDLPLNSSKLILVKCDICGKERELEFRLYMKNYNKYNCYTCYECSKFKIKKTFINNYGVDNPMKNEDIKNKLKNTIKVKYGEDSYLKSDDKKIKSSRTCLIKYGFENPMKNINVQIKAKETKKERYGENYEKITEKIIKTKKERYGENYEKINEKIIKTNNFKYNCDYPLQNINIYNKTVDTCIDKYGELPFKNKEIRKKLSLSHKKTTFKNIKKKYPNINFISKDNGVYKIKCDKCNNVYEINFNLFFLRNMGNNTLCTICNDPKVKHISDFEFQISDFLKENNINHITGDRSILNGKELDIYLPQYNIAIECNGLYWHSELFKDKDYHRYKQLLCKEKNIELLHIWEDDWKYKQDIIKSMLLNKFGLIENKIYARKCIIKEVSNNDLIRNFLNENHIQGYVKSNIKIGLFYKEELISLMTFGNRKINGKEEYELIRFCNKKHYVVIGSASKIFHYFLKNVKNKKDIISYSDNSFFNGNLYEKLGFEYMRETELNYYWIVNNVREHRFKYNKKKLINDGYDKNKTEYQIMTENGYYRLWSCGMKKWIYRV